MCGVFFHEFRGIWGCYVLSLTAVLSHRTSVNKPPEMTLERAVNVLTEENNEETLIYAASLIQSQCFKSVDAKRIVGLFLLFRLIFLLDHFTVTQNRICLKLGM